MSNTPTYAPIKDFDTLITAIKEEKAQLDAGEKAGHLKSHLVRRIPISFGAGFISFLGCFLLIATKAASTEEVSQTLKQLIIFHVPSPCLGPQTGIALALLALVGGHACKLGKSFKTAQHVCLCFASLSTFSACLNTAQPVPLGLLCFGTISLCAMLADRTLGYTKSNERYQLFSRKLGGLVVMSESRKARGIPLEEVHLLEFAKIFDDLRTDKHSNTVADTQRPSELIIEKFFPASAKKSDKTKD